MKLGSSFRALSMFIHIQINMFPTTTGPIPLQGTSEHSGRCLNHGKHPPPHFPHFREGCEWKMGLGFLEVYIL